MSSEKGSDQTKSSYLNTGLLELPYLYEYSLGGKESQLFILFSLTVLKCLQVWGKSRYQDSKVPKSVWLKLKSCSNVLLNNLQTNIVLYFIIEQESQKGH